MILVLGGTSDAREIATGLMEVGADFVVSLSGATTRSAVPEYPVRTGGFGGVDGLVEYLGKAEIAAIIDATHPFAANISRSAAVAAEVSGVPIVRFDRPEWAESEAADWRCVDDLGAAAHALPSGSRAFLTVGSRSLEPFISRADVWFLFRSIENTGMPFVQGEALIDRPPFTMASEIELMRRHRITHLVTKNSGGGQTCAKLEAAADLGVPVIVVGRPVLPVVESASTVSGILRWAEQI